MGVTAQVISLSLTHWTRLEGQAIRAGAARCPPTDPAWLWGFSPSSVWSALQSRRSQEGTRPSPRPCAPRVGLGRLEEGGRGRRLPWCSGVPGRGAQGPAGSGTGVAGPAPSPSQPRGLAGSGHRGGIEGRSPPRFRTEPGGPWEGPAPHTARQRLRGECRMGSLPHLLPPVLKGPANTPNPTPT